jgi:hypothetical protein
MKMWGKYVYKYDAWKVQCISLGWNSEYVKVPLEMLSYGQLIYFIYTFAEPLFRNMNLSYFLDKHRVIFLPAGLVTT